MHRENGNLIAEKKKDGGENGCRNDATKMHRENGNLIAVKWTEGKMVAAMMRQKGIDILSALLSIKLYFIGRKMPECLHMSKKSSTFAANLELTLKK